MPSGKATDFDSVSSCRLVRGFESHNPNQYAAAFKGEERIWLLTVLTSAHVILMLGINVVVSKQCMK